MGCRVSVRGSCRQALAHPHLNSCTPELLTFFIASTLCVRMPTTSNIADSVKAAMRNHTRGRTHQRVCSSSPSPSSSSSCVWGGGGGWGVGVHVTGQVRQGQEGVVEGRLL